jgi:hypothetical protein
MPYNGSGGFTRLMNWSNDALAGIKIKADRHDQEDDNFASGLTNAITKDGQTQPTANIPMNGNRITNLGTPTVDTDAVTKAYADTPKPFTTGATISGADINGRLNFTSPTGANGLTFTGADLSWLARLATAAGPGTPPVPPATLNRMVLNDKPDGSGTDVAVINDTGAMTITGAFTAAGTVIATPTIAAKATSGNVHMWLYGPNNEDRCVIYTNAAAAGTTTLRVTGTQSYTFGTDGVFTAPVQVRAGGAIFDTGGNISGAGNVWTNWGAGDAYNAISARIEARATAWANDRVSNLQYRKVSQGLSGGSTNWVAPAGAVVNGYVREAGGSGQVSQLYYMYLQVYDPVRGWVGFSG